MIELDNSNKKGWIYGNNKSWYSLGFGVLCVILGGIPLLSWIGIGALSWSVGLFIFEDIVIKIFLVLAGIFLLVDSFNVDIRFGRFWSVVAGILLAVLGGVPLAIDYNLLNFLPFKLDLKSVPSFVFQALLVFYGIYLIVDAFIMKDFVSGERKRGFSS